MAGIGDSVAWDILFSVSVLGAILVLVGFLRMVLTRGFRHQVKSVFIALRRTLATMGDIEVQQEEVRRIIDEKMNAGKVRQFRMTLQCFGLVGLLGCVNTISEVASQTESPETPGRSILMALSHVHAAFVGFIWPRAITPSNLDAHFFVLVLMWTLAASPPFVREETLLGNMLLQTVLVALLDGARRTVPRQRFPVLAVCNIGFACSTSSSIIVHGGSAFTVPVIIAAFHCFVMGLVCFAAMSLEAGFRATIFRGMQFEEVKELHAAARAVLRSYCEVVVELDSQGYITSSARDLRCFLLRSPHSALSHSQGSRLTDFIAYQEERDLFVQRLEESRQQKSSIAETLQVTMQDGCDNKLRLELMWFQFKSLDHSLHLMLGIREFSDTSVQRVQSLPSRLEPGEDPSSHLNLAAGGRSALGNSESSPRGGEPNGAASVCSSVPEDATVGSNDMEEASPMLVVDSMGPGMPIQSMTPAFCTQFGRLPLRHSILKYVKSSWRFEAWFQREVNAFNFGEETCEPEFHVTLQMPSGQSIPATVRVAVSDDMEEVDMCSIGLRFSKVPSHNILPGGRSLHGTPARARLRADPAIVKVSL